MIERPSQTNLTLSVASNMELQIEIGQHLQTGSGMIGELCLGAKA